MKTGKITINESLNRNGVERLDSVTHEMNHLAHPKMSERAIINKTKKDRESLLAII